MRSLSDRLLDPTIGLRVAGLCLAGILLHAASGTADEASPVEPPLIAPKTQKSTQDRPAYVLPKSWMDSVEVIPKTALGIREEEAASYYRILRHVKTLSPDVLRAGELAFRKNRIDEYIERIGELYEKDQRENPDTADILRSKRQEMADGFQQEPMTYPLVVDAFNRPSECAGRIVSFAGHVRKVTKMPAPEKQFNEDGELDDLYELWLYDVKSPRLPVCVVCTEIPDNLPTNLKENDVIDGVSVRGYFFKMYAYPGQEKLQAVPLILAHRVTWNPPEHVPFEMPTWAYGILVAIGVLSILLIFRSRRRDPHLQEVRERLKPLDENPFKDLSETP